MMMTEKELFIEKLKKEPKISQLLLLIFAIH